MSSIIVHLLWQLIAAGALLVGFGLGILFGRARMALRLRGDIMEAQDKAEWERARREQLARQIEETKNAEHDVKQESAEDGMATAGVLRRELERLREELRRTWEGQSEAQRRIQELEARLSILVAKPTRRVGSAAVGDRRAPDGDLTSRQKAAGENILTLWNASVEEPMRPAADDRAKG